MENPIVSIVKNKVTPDENRIIEMAKEAVDLIGGMESIVTKGDVVAIKANFFAPYPPPVTVDRRTVRAIIRMLYQAGASKVILAEGCSVGTKLGRNTITAEIVEELGIAEVAAEEGAELLMLEDAERVLVKVPDAKSISEIYYPKALLDCDVLVDLPCMKMHGMTLVTLGIKNFQGLLNDEQKYYAHRDDLEQKLVDIFKIRKPDLTFIDGITAMEGNGAGEHGDPHPMNMFIASKDVVAADAVATACMGIDDVLDVIATRIAQYDGIGCADLNKIKVVGAQIDEVKEKFKYPEKQAVPLERMLLGNFENVDVRVGGACRQCWYLAISMARTLSKYKDEKFTLVLGADPKVANQEMIDTEGVVIFGDCACAATGNIKDLRNRMLIEGKGVIAAGCPPYRPATAAVEKYLIARGLLDEKSLEIGNEKSKKRTYDYYRTVDPTWIPKSEK